MKKIIMLWSLFSAFFFLAEGQNPLIKLPPTTKNNPAVLDIPPDNTVKTLRRFHSVYNPTTRNYEKEYFQRKYWVYFKLPYQSYVQICGTKDPVLNTNTENPYDAPLGNRKPLSFCQFFSPKILVVNKTTGEGKYYPVPIGGDYGKRISTAGYQIRLDGPGQYDIKFQQTFPAEAEFRSIVRLPIGFSVSSDLEIDAFNAEVKQLTDELVNRYRNFLGKTVVRTIYHFNANYDFLVATIGDSYMSGEGNPMLCGEVIPGNNGSLGDTIVELVEDVTDRIKESVRHFGNALSDQSYSEYLAGLFTLGTAVSIPVVEQIIGPCTIPELNMANLTAPNFDIPPSWIENGNNADLLKTSRSYINGAGLAAFTLENKYPGIASSYISYATSGAVAENLYQVKQHAYQRGSQIDDLAQNLAGSNREIDALMIGIGANDISFSSDIISLLTNDVKRALEKSASPFLMLMGAIISTDNNAQLRTKVLAKINGLDEKFRLLDEKIRSSLRVKKVFLLEYPNAQFSVVQNGQFKITGGCDVLDGTLIRIDQADARLMTDLGDLLNLKLASLAAKYNWHFIPGMTAAFQGHGYCSTDRFYLKPGESCRCQGNYQGMLHPNGKGFKKVAEQVLRKLEQVYDFNRLKKPVPVIVNPHTTQ